MTRLPMPRLLRAELLKLRTTRMWWALLLIALGLVALNVVLTIAFAGRFDTPGLDSDDTVRNVWAAAAQANLFALVLGILVLAGEYRHMTITSTYLAAPRRSRVVVAKLVVGAAAGLAYGAAACGLTALLAGPLLAARGATGSADVARILLGALLVTVLYGVIGVGLGALVRNSIVAVVGALVWVFVLEQLLLFLLPALGRWLPGGATNSLVQATLPGASTASLPAWAAALLLLAYGVVLAAAGSLTTLRRDVT